MLTPIGRLSCVVGILALSPPLAAEAPAGPSVDGDKLVCKVEAKTGSRFPTKTCRTKAEWEQIRMQHQRELKEMIDRPKIEINRGG